MPSSDAPTRSTRSLEDYDYDAVFRSLGFPALEPLSDEPRFDARYSFDERYIQVIDPPFGPSGALADIVLAHELTHALDDEHFIVDLDADSDTGDSSLAHEALVEGSASWLEYEYMRHHVPDLPDDGGEPNEPADYSAEQETGDFPYVEGSAFVEALVDEADGKWDLVDKAFRERPPKSTEHILHPESYLNGDDPKPVPVEAPRAGLHPLDYGTFGEFGTRQLLELDGDDHTDDAEGWGGDRFELWQKGDGECRTPCPDRDVLVVRWIWDTEEDARAFRGAVRSMLERGRDAVPMGGNLWALDDAGAALAIDGEYTTLVFAPSPREAERYARQPVPPPDG